MTSQIDPSPLLAYDLAFGLQNDSSAGDGGAADFPTGEGGDGEGEGDVGGIDPLFPEAQDDAKSPPTTAYSKRSPSRLEYVLHPIRSTKTYFSTLSSIFSWQFLSWLAVNNFAIAGGVFTLLLTVSLPIFKELGIDADRQQLYTTMIMSPWAMKPFIGVASDLFPIGGYNKKYFAVYSIFIGVGGCIALLVIWHSGQLKKTEEAGQSAVQTLADVLVVCFTLVSFEGAALDILSEGKYSEFLREHPESGSGIISYKFGWSLLGGIVTQLYVGPLADAGLFHILFWIALVLSLMPLYPTLRDWLPEKKRSVDEPGMIKVCTGCLFDRGAFRKNKMQFIVITLSGLAGPVMAAVTTFAHLEIGLIVSGLMILALMATTYVFFPRIVLQVLLFMVFQTISAPRISSALAYFYTADEECLPDGPNFSYTYYITVTGIVGSIVNLLAVVLYQSFLGPWRFRPALIFTMVLGSLAPLIDLIIVMRWNVKIGISDKVFFLLGNAVFENLIVILQAIPMSAIYAKVCPPGMESAVFAYVVGVGNFCMMFSGLSGSAVIKWSSLETVGTDCNFDELPNMIVLYNVLLPLLIGIPATFLIPNVLQTENLIDWEKENWTGSGASAADTTGDRSDDKGGSNNIDSRIEPHLL